MDGESGRGARAGEAEQAIPRSVAATTDVRFTAVAV
jgi:hypothetical protein